MARKTISLREETYERLRRARMDDESVSDVIDRLLGEDEQPLYGLVGLGDDETVDRMKEESRAFREAVDGRMEQTELDEE